ncbi:MAG: 2-hydroxychromene-2-carboxylate isomerase [Pseudomonadota bacterium]
MSSAAAPASPLPHLHFYFDVLSPYAYLAFERLPQALAGLSYSVSYQPVFLPALLKHWGQKGPVEIAPKREWVLHQVDWLARRHGIPLQWPAVHPFNPLPLLRLAQACVPAVGGTPSRWVTEAVLRHVWCGEGADPCASDRLAALEVRLAPAGLPGGDAKAALTQATNEAIALGVFGVPTLALRGRLYWGLDSLDMVAEALQSGT